MSKGDMDNYEKLINWAGKLGVAEYQIRRAVAMLKDTEWARPEQAKDIALSVAAQLRAYLESVEDARPPLFRLDGLEEQS